MKSWVNAEIETLEITATANGKNDNKFEGIDGVDAKGEYNQYINKNGTGILDLGRLAPGGTDSVSGE